ncbi:uncharacterized protein LOC129224275 [Uloborus diversus]|uniref:uncharacterized protein LOC129224275 n=1 Tax=Uloborus diversus TaxID=327109 RepID=UPI00240A926B|nr:uncharacterized protein LOC129224275 [Uloborus diversus]
MDKSDKSGQSSRWLITFRNPKEVFDDHTSYLAVEILFYVCFLLTLKHVLRYRGRYLYLWIAALIHGLAIECMSYIIPDVDNFWHAQSTIMLFGQRLPLHIVCFYPVLIYTASVAVSRLKLPLWSEIFAVGIATVVLDFPWDVLGIKLLWWSFHDTDPNINERFYWVPWTSFFFFGATTSSLTFCLHFFRRLATGNKKYEASGCFTEFGCSLASGLLAIPLAILQFVLFYHIPHDIYRVPTNVCVVILLDSILSSWLDWGLVGNLGKKSDELLLLVLLYFTFFIVTVFLAKPEEIFSVGLHQPIGNCDEKVAVHTPIGKVLSKNKYLCPSRYDGGYFDFHCAMQPTENWKHKEWYIICGTAFENRNEYIAIITSSSIFGIFFFYQLLINSGRDALAGVSNLVEKFKLR